MSWRFSLACWFVAAFAGLPGCEGQSCTAMGCTNGASISGEITKPTGAVVIQLCLNDSCNAATWDPTANPGMCAGVGSQEPRTSICFADATQPGMQTVFGGVTIWQIAAHSGDHYVLTITDQQSGAVLGIADTHAKYSDMYPNGPDCDPEPCKVTKLKIAPP